MVSALLPFSSCYKEIPSNLEKVLGSMCCQFQHRQKMLPLIRKPWHAQSIDCQISCSSRRPVTLKSDLPIQCALWKFLMSFDNLLIGNTNTFKSPIMERNWRGLILPWVLLHSFSLFLKWIDFVEDSTKMTVPSHGSPYIDWHMQRKSQSSAPILHYTFWKSILLWMILLKRRELWMAENVLTRIVAWQRW